MYFALPAADAIQWPVSTGQGICSVLFTKNKFFTVFNSSYSVKMTIRGGAPGIAVAAAVHQNGASFLSS